MSLVDEEGIINIFKLLNKNKLNYILIRNINQELPHKLEVGKDIDILINKNEEKKFISFLKENSYKQLIHPFRYDTFLYGVNRLEFRYKNNKDILFDPNFQIIVRSFEAGQWIPLDQIIQKSAWENKRFHQQDSNFGYWTLSYDDEFVCLVARCVFDKKEFQDGYKKRIDELYSMINKEDVLEKLNLIFFKFTPYIMELIKEKNYDNIIKNYLQFKEY